VPWGANVFGKKPETVIAIEPTRDDELMLEIFLYCLPFIKKNYRFDG
jgi:hypothetical protein